MKTKVKVRFYRPEEWGHPFLWCFDYDWDKWVGARFGFDKDIYKHFRM